MGFSETIRKDFKCSQFLILEAIETYCVRSGPTTNTFILFPTLSPTSFFCSSSLSFRVDCGERERGDNYRESGKEIDRERVIVIVREKGRKVLSNLELKGN